MHGCVLIILFLLKKIYDNQNYFFLSRPKWNLHGHNIYSYNKNNNTFITILYILLSIYDLVKNKSQRKEINLQQSIGTNILSDNIVLQCNIILEILLVTFCIWKLVTCWVHLPTKLTSTVKGIWSIAVLNYLIHKRERTLLQVLRS